MIQPWWKKKWSHFSDIVIERIKTEDGQQLELFLSKGRYQLCVEDAIYSFEDLYDNFWDVFQLMDLATLENKEILLLGLGLGSIPVMLEKMGLKAHYTGVEKEEVIIYLFNKYILQNLNSPIEVFTADVFPFIEMNERKYDLIAMDVFVGDTIPEKFLDIGFLNSLSNALSPDGVLIWNHLYHYERDRDATDSFYENIFSKVFKEASFIQTRGNKMLLNKKIVNSQPKK